jgi:hypothetical protein
VFRKALSTTLIAAACVAAQEASPFVPKVTLLVNPFALLRPALDLSLEYRVAPHWGAMLMAAGGREESESDVTTTEWNLGSQARWYPGHPARQTQPFGLAAVEYFRRTNDFGDFESHTRRTEISLGGGAKYFTHGGGFTVEAVLRPYIVAQSTDFGLKGNVSLGWSF